MPRLKAASAAFYLMVTWALYITNLTFFAPLMIFDTAGVLYSQWSGDLGQRYSMGFNQPYCNFRSDLTLLSAPATCFWLLNRCTFIFAYFDGKFIKFIQES